MTLRPAAILVSAALGIAGLACSNKQSAPRVAPEVSGLAAVPASAEVVIVADVSRIINAPLVARAFELLLARDPALASRWDELRKSCSLDGKQFSHVTLATGPASGGQPGTGPVLIVATGRLVETEFAACVRAMVGKGGGALTAKPVATNRTLYEAKQGGRAMYFAFGRADTVVMGANEAFVMEALGTGKKVLDNGDMAAWSGLANQRAPLWAIGKVNPRVGEGLAKVMGGASGGPQGMFASLDLAAGAAFEVGAVMATEKDAKMLETFAKTQLGLLAMAAQAKSLGAVVSKFQISTGRPGQPPIVRFAASLDPDDVNQLISALDAGGGSAQISPPQAPSSGSGSAGQ